MDKMKSLAIALAVSGVAVAAAGATSPAAAQTAGNWSGPHIGGSAGYGGGTQAQQGGILVLPGGGNTTTGGPNTIADGHYSLGGGLVGGGVGYNWQQDRVVFGLEADGSWADISGNGICGTPNVNLHACGGAIRGFGTVRGILGFDIGRGLSPAGNAMVYGTGGLAVANIRAWDAMFNTSGDSTRAGWTLGAGIEQKISRNWSVKLEYLHADFGTHGIFTAIQPNVEQVTTRADIGRIGLSYYFDAPAPMMPTYPVKAPRK
jgi:outer membrane immunogenic protein